MSKHKYLLVQLALLSLLLIAQVGNQGTPGTGAFDYTEHFDVDDSLSGWSVAHSNWAVEDSILTLTPIGQSILYIYDPMWEGIPWPDYDIHMGARSIGCNIKVQCAVWITNGTDWEDIWGTEYTLSADWLDYEWERDDFYAVSHLDGDLNLTEVDFFFWCPAGGYTRPGWGFNLLSVVDDPYAEIDYISTVGNGWSDDVEDEIEAGATSEAASETTSEAAGDGGGGTVDLETSDPIASLLAFVDSTVAGLEEGNPLSWGIVLIIVLLLIGFFYWLGTRKKG